MPKVVVTAQIEDSIRWEEGFRTRGDLFRSQTVTKTIDFGIRESNEIAVCMEPDDLDKFLETMASPAIAEAMDSDGINRETVKIFVLDKEFKV